MKGEALVNRDLTPYLPLVERLSGVRVLVVGDVMLDHYVFGSAERISPEAPVPVVRVSAEQFRLGGAANVAVNLAALGGQVALLGLIGNVEAGRPDADGERVSALCHQAGIAAELPARLPRTVRKTRVLAARQQMLRVDWEAAAPQTAGDGEKLAVLDRRLPECDVVLVSDYAKGVVDPELMARLARSGKPVVVDPRPQHGDLYRGVTLITPNRKEARELLGWGEWRPAPGEELGAALAEKLSAAVLVTLGDAGMCLVRRGQPTASIAARAREVFDVTGAGDTVAAVMALGLGAGLDLLDSAQLANAAAGVAVAHIGAVAVSPAELRRALGAPAAE